MKSMTTATIASVLRAKQKELKLSIHALSKAIGANTQSVTSALKGASIPNATTAPKYAAFLGISLDEFKTLAAAAKGTVPAMAPSAVKISKVVKVKSVKKPGKSVKKLVATQKPVTLAEAAELAADSLAVATHRATADQRRVITAVLGN